MEFSTIVLQVNTYRLTGSDFRLDVQTFEMMAITSFYAEKCCHLVLHTQLPPDAHSCSLAPFQMSKCQMSLKVKWPSQCRMWTWQLRQT